MEIKFTLQLPRDALSVPVVRRAEQLHADPGRHGGLPAGMHRAFKGKGAARLAACQEAAYTGSHCKDSSQDRKLALAGIPSGCGKAEAA